MCSLSFRLQGITCTLCSRPPPRHSLHRSFILPINLVELLVPATSESNFMDLLTKSALCGVYINRQVSAEVSCLFLSDMIKNTSRLCSAEWTQVIKAESPPHCTVYAENTDTLLNWPFCYSFAPRAFKGVRGQGFILERRGSRLIKQTLWCQCHLSSERRKVFKTAVKGGEHC